MDNTRFFATVKNIWANEGLTGYYKGVSGPLASVPFLNAIIFATFEVSKKFLQHLKQTDRISLTETGVAGGIAGLFNTLIVTPVELVKCKMQMQKKLRKYKSSAECFKKLILKNGLRGSSWSTRRFPGQRGHTGPRGVGERSAVRHLRSLQAAPVRPAQPLRSEPAQTLGRG